MELGGRDDCVVRLLPPLNVAAEVVDLACAILVDAVDVLCPGPASRWGARDWSGSSAESVAPARLRAAAESMAAAQRAGSEGRRGHGRHDGRAGRLSGPSARSGRRGSSRR